jgi:hypothetical protein
MNLFDAFKDDWEVFDDYQTVMVEDTDNGCSVRIHGANPTAMTKQQMTLSGLLGTENETKSWSLPRVNMNGWKLKNGQTITDEDGVVWVINSLDEDPVGTWFDALCTKKAE